jgi:hypothetical protein
MKVPEIIPVELYNRYSMDGKVKIEYSYRDDSGVEAQQKINAGFTQEEFDQCVEKIKKREYNYYMDTDLWLYDAFDKYPIEGKHICIVGSAYPWYEAMSIVFGAEKCTVIEYSDRECFHPLIKYIKPTEPNEEKYDVCISISSFEHDGLGRYGDPLNPDGDLEAMKKMKDLVKKDGLMYLAVPLGLDHIYFNAHRIYGNHRFLKLLEGWELLDGMGFRPETFSNSYNNEEWTPYQPVCVLKNI